MTDENNPENPTSEESAEQAEETPVAESQQPEAGVTESEVDATEPVVEEPEPAAQEEPVAEEAPAAEPASDEVLSEEPATVELPAVYAPADEAVAVAQARKKRKRLPRALRHKHSKVPRERAATRKPIVRTPKPESEPGRRQERRGVVVSDKGDKTIVVAVDTTKLHPMYKKVVRRRHKLHAHDEQNAATIGDVVRIVETRPISKTKNWRLAEIVEKAR
jgi:small subunit ribosomal protein S17